LVLKIKFSDVQAAVGAVLSAIGWFIGGSDGLLYTLIVLAVTDYLTGVVSGVLNREISSKTGALGIARKVMMFVLVGVANVMDKYLPGNGSAMRSAVLFFYISNEGISLIENASEIGLPVPEALKGILKKIGEGKNEDN
jgi:toxin secretion/phage lysis holin